MTDLCRSGRSLVLVVLDWFKYQQILGLLDELGSLVLQSFLLFFLQSILLHLSTHLRDANF